MSGSILTGRARTERQALKPEHLSADTNIVLQGNDGAEYILPLGALRAFILKSEDSAAERKAKP